MTITITVKFGLSNMVVRDFTAPVTVGTIVDDPSIRAALQCGENFNVLLGGSTKVEKSYQLNSSCMLRLETIAASKAA